MQVKLGIAGLALALTGCAGPIHDAGSRAAEGMLDALDTPKYRQEFSDVSAAGAASARDALMDPASVSPKLQAIATTVVPTLKLQLVDVPDILIGAHTRTLSLNLVDTSLSHVNDYLAQWSETAFGKPLRDKFDALAADAKDKLPGVVQGSLAPVSVTVDATEAKAERVAEWIGLGLLALLIVVEGWAHRRALQRIVDARR